MPTTGELPESCPFSDEYGELDEMIHDLGREHDLPDGIHPDLVGGDPDWCHYWGNGQEERHKQSVEWRVKLFHELKARPEWVRQWRAEREMDRRVEALCEAKGLQFNLHELPPWDVPAEGEPPKAYANHPFMAGWPMAQRLRRQLEAEIRGERRR